MFRDRDDAGQQLADELTALSVGADIVLAIPRGGLPLGRPVADRLGVPLDVIVAWKMGAPNNEELALGAVAEDGSRWLNDEIIEELGVGDDVLEPKADLAKQEAKKKATAYRDGPPPELDGKRIVIVDDGVATGATMRACLAMARNADPEYLVAAVPVGAADTLAAMIDEADQIVSVEQPAAFRAVGAYYQNFDQVSDEEAREYLNESD